MIWRNWLLLVGILFGSHILAQTTLTVEVELNDPTAGGEVQLALYNSEDDFDDDRGGQLRTVSAATKVVTIVFADLPPGTYALKIFHDADSDKKLTTNIVGIPKESYGFSNNVMGSFGPPTFDQAAFDVGNVPFTVRVKLKG